MKNVFLIIAATFFSAYSYKVTAQNIFPSTGSAGIGTTNPNASAILEMKSTTQGVLIPRMTKTQRDAIVSPVKGLLIYQTNSTQGFYYYDGTNWTAVTPKSKDWSLTGNSSIDPAVNFLGTTDAQPLKFKVNNIPAGELNPTNGNIALGMNSLSSNTTGHSNVAIGTNTLFTNSTRSNLVAVGDSALFHNGSAILYFATANTAIGSKALFSNTSGYYNTASGFETLYSNTSGNSNTANGYRALYSNTTASFNTANGFGALYSNTTAYYNTATGYKVLYSNTTGSSNTAIGWSALLFNTTGNYNTASGSNALFENTTGGDNTANGYSALYFNTTGYSNTANGFQALYSNSTGNYNTANGAHTLYYNNTGEENTATGYSTLHLNTTGYDNTANGVSALFSNTIGYDNTATGAYSLFNNTANFNTADGFEALYNNTTGTWNTATGDLALFNNLTGSYNTAYGERALYLSDAGANSAYGAYALEGNTSGTSNVAVGKSALSHNTTGTGNTAIGAGADVPALSNLTDATAIGYNAVTNANDKIVLGTSANNNLTGGFGAWQNFSDGRFKEHVQGNVPGLAFITKLHPVTYNLNAEKVDEFLGIKQRMDTCKDAEQKARYLGRLKEVSAQLQTGFIAQEVEATAKSIGYEFDGVHHPESEIDNYTIGYSTFVVPLVKAVQELDSMNASKDEQIKNLESENAEMKLRLDKVDQQLALFDQSLAECCTNYKSSIVNGESSIDEAKLEQNIPNPFTSTTIIKFYVPQRATSVIIKIYSLEGVELKSFNVNQKGYGEISVTGNSLASGVYAYTLIIDGQAIDTKQMILTK